MPMSAVLAHRRRPMQTTTVGVSSASTDRGLAVPTARCDMGSE